MKKQPTQAQLQMQVDAFNYNFKVGDIVNVRTDSGSIDQDMITHEATIMGGHTAMAWLKYRGSYLADRISKHPELINQHPVL